MQEQAYKDGRGRGNGGSMRRRISPSMVVALAALFFSLTGAGFAAQRYLITSKSQIAPWVRAALKGNRGPQGLAGPRGAQGAIGPTGPMGATGPRGPIAATGSERSLIFTGSTTLEPGEQQVLPALCPTDRSTAGGFTAPAGVQVLESRPLGKDVGLPYDQASGWTITAVNTTSSPANVSVWASCAP